MTTRQSGIAEGDALARRYPADVAPFAAIVDTSPAAFASLERLIPPGGRVALFTVDPVAPPDRFTVGAARTAEQMVATSMEAPSAAVDIVPLGAADVPAMLALVELTRPGPFAARTHELGDFFGIRVGGALVAMTGERMKLDGFTEVTAVCTHPDYRGRGYARALLAHVARRVLERGEVPCLHVFSDNAAAIELYLRSGLIIRKRMHVTGLGHRAA